jgi:hypothetical protein
MGSPGGYQINPGLYRVPDLLTQEQFIDYVWNTYGRRIEFTDGAEINPARALGQTHPVGPVDEVDADKMSPNAVNDPVLRHLNNMSFGPNYASTPKEERENENSPVDSVQDEPGLDSTPEVSVNDAPPIPVDEVNKKDK